ncbi:hypothetical protein K3495_g12502 [Podosphaera aphanis]|nr:hypothetical protein K3495_g12502 [Podosphaera aphanis]
MPPKRTAFQVDEKVALRVQHTQFPHQSQKELDQWFEAQFGKAITQGTVSQILSKASAHLDQEGVLSTKRKQRHEDYPVLEKALAQFIIERQQQLIINGDVVRHAARQIWRDLPQYQGLE